MTTMTAEHVRTALRKNEALLKRNEAGLAKLNKQRRTLRSIIARELMRLIENVEIGEVELQGDEGRVEELHHDSLMELYVMRQSQRELYDEMHEISMELMHIKDTLNGMLAQFETEESMQS